jgi:hypothetical protein
MSFKYLKDHVLLDVLAFFKSLRTFATAASTSHTNDSLTMIALENLYC